MGISLLWLVGSTAIVGFLLSRNLKKNLPIHSGGEDKMIMNRTPKRVEVIPDDLIVEILSFLPVKSVLRFKCVCKSWQNITLDSSFIKKYDSRGSWQTVYEKISKPKIGIRLRLDKNDLVLEKSEKTCNDETFLYKDKTYALVLEGSEKTGKYRIRNPSTKQVLQVLDDPEVQKSQGFMKIKYVSSTNNHKLIHIHIKEGTSELGFRILTVGTDLAWRPLDISLPFHGTPLKFTNYHDIIDITSFHTAEVEKTEILRIMLKDESFKKIKIPTSFQTSGDKFMTFKWDNKLSLGVIINKELHLWVLENDNNHIWSEKKIIPLGFMEENVDKISYISASQGQELQIHFDNNTLYYNIDSMKTRIVKGRQGKKVSYYMKPSLVSLKGMHSEDIIDSWRVIVSLRGVMQVFLRKGLWKFLLSDEVVNRLSQYCFSTMKVW